MVSLFSPDGTQYLDDLSDFLSLECVLSEGNIGTVALTLPAGHNYTNFRRDARIAYYRAPSADLVIGQPRFRLVGNTVWLLAGRKRTIDLTNQRETTTLKCAHPNHLLARRVVAYSEKSSQADKSGAADNLIKAYVRENFTTATDTTRNWGSTLFAVENDLLAAPVVDKAASERTVLTVCQELASAASAAGTYTNFEITGMERGALRLRTYTGQRGADRSSTGQTLIISVMNGAFDTVELEEDWFDMASFVYAGGSGKQDERWIGTASDSVLIGDSPYGRIEWFQNAANADTQAVVDDEAARALRERRPRIVFSGAVKDTFAATFMDEYDHGDRVVGEFARPNATIDGFTDVLQFDCRVDPVRIRVERTENPETGEQQQIESLDIRLRSEA